VEKQSLPYFVPLLTRKPNLDKSIFVQTNSFIISTCLNPVLLVQGFGQVGKREDWWLKKIAERKKKISRKDKNTFFSKCGNPFSEIGRLLKTIEKPELTFYIGILNNLKCIFMYIVFSTHQF
jgi:hypothetical protein